MDLGALLRELQGGQTGVIRYGLGALVCGAFMLLVAMVLLQPTMDGLTNLPGYDIEAHADVATSIPAAAPALTPAQRMSMRRNAVRVARGELAAGVREVAGENNGWRIRVYRNAVIGVGESRWAAEPWCADFVSWIWARAGAPLGFGGQGSDYVPELVGWAKFTGRWKSARNGYRPRPGDLIVFRSGEDRQGHIGLVARVGGGRVHTIEGNYSDRVKRRSIKPWSSQVTGFIAPV